MLISVVSLLFSSRLHVVPCQFNVPFQLLHQFIYSVVVDSVQWYMSREVWVVTIVEVEGCEPSGCMHTAVYCYLCCCQVLIPVILLLAHIVSQYVLQCSVGALGLAICLWMMGCAHFQFGTQQAP